MSARTWWSAKAGANPPRSSDSRAGEGPDLADGRPAGCPLRRGGPAFAARPWQPPAHRRAARSAAGGDERDELDLAVQKLSEGLEAIERQSRAARRPAARSAISRRTAAEAAGDRDFVTYSLDRLEARLEALSKRLQQRQLRPPQPRGRAHASCTARRPVSGGGSGRGSRARSWPKLAPARRRPKRRAAPRRRRRSGTRQLEAAEQARRAAERPLKSAAGRLTLPKPGGRRR